MRTGRTAPLSYLMRYGPALLALGLGACGEPVPQGPPPIPEAALAAVVEDPGAPREGVARALDALFTREDIGETRAVVVMHRGEIVAERYAEGYDAKTRLIGWSMSKTVTAVMIGMLVADGRLHMDRSPPIPRWQRSGDPRGEITLRQLLQMRSGLRHNENSGPPEDTDTVHMLFLEGRDDTARFAEDQPLDEQPGRSFNYSSANTIILSDIAARILTDKQDPVSRRQAVDEFLKARIFVPLGLDSAVAEYDAAGTMLGASMIYANARDWAKFGEFLRHGGSVRGAQLVPRGWIDFMKRSSPRADDYGAQLWLNRPTESGRRILFAERGPDSLVGMVGHLGQYTLVSPRQGLTVVRLGKTDEGQREALEDALADLVQLYPVG